MNGLMGRASSTPNGRRNKETQCRLISIPNQPSLLSLVSAGDLAQRKLIPALYDLFLDHWLPEKFLVLGLGHKSLGDKTFIEHLRQGVIQFSRRKETDGPPVEGLCLSSDLSDRRL